MRLLFVHGWGFDATFWNGLTGQLPNIETVKIELGFLGAPVSIPKYQPGDVLVGHSLGFAWGMTQIQAFPRWVSINGFARFTSDDPTGCVPAANLRAMQRNLTKHPLQTLQDFHALIGSPDQPTTFNQENLTQGLAQLGEFDIGPQLGREDSDGLILASTDDMLVPVAATEYMAAQCRGVDVIWHRHGGHLLPINEPAWCAAEIKKFLGL